MAPCGQRGHLHVPRTGLGPGVVTDGGAILPQGMSGDSFADHKGWGVAMLLPSSGWRTGVLLSPRLRKTPLPQQRMTRSPVSAVKR